LSSHCINAETVFCADLLAVALAALSAAISGWAVFAAYPKFLLHLREQPFAGVFPQAMANFRGLSYLLVHNDGSPFAIFTTAFLSVSALLIALIGWQGATVASYPICAPKNQAAFDVAFGNTILFALLISYHLNPHDLSLLLLPISLLLYRVRVEGRFAVTKPARWLVEGLIALLFLPPLHLLALEAHRYVMVAVPLLALLIICTFLLRRNRAQQLS
jgi:aromatic ring-cleaving dioxygenase